MSLAYPWTSRLLLIFLLLLLRELRAFLSQPRLSVASYALMVITEKMGARAVLRGPKAGKGIITEVVAGLRDVVTVTTIATGNKT